MKTVKQINEIHKKASGIALQESSYIVHFRILVLLIRMHGALAGRLARGTGTTAVGSRRFGWRCFGIVLHGASTGRGGRTRIMLHGASTDICHRYRGRRGSHWCGWSNGRGRLRSHFFSAMCCSASLLRLCAAPANLIDLATSFVQSYPKVCVSSFSQVPAHGVLLLQI